MVVLLTPGRGATRFHGLRKGLQGLQIKALSQEVRLLATSFLLCNLPLASSTHLPSPATFGHLGYLQGVTRMAYSPRLWLLEIGW